MFKKVFFTFAMLFYAFNIYAASNNDIKNLINHYYSAIQNENINWIKSNFKNINNRQLKIFKAVFKATDQKIIYVKVKRIQNYSTKAIVFTSVKSEVFSKLNNKHFTLTQNSVFLLEKDLKSRWKIARILSYEDFKILLQAHLIKALMPQNNSSLNNYSYNSADSGENFLPDNNSQHRNKTGVKYSYVGCFRDKGNPYGYKNRDINGFGFNSKSLTIQKCINECARRGYKYAGLQYSIACFCGNSFGRFSKANNCNMPCSGNKNQICGGSWANSVYKILNPKTEISYPEGVEVNIDRPGKDYKNFDLPYPDYNLCKTACEKEPSCRAWTYIKPYTIQGAKPRCWLKNGIPNPTHNNCCISGIKNKTKTQNKPSGIVENWFKHWKILNSIDFKINNSNEKFGWKYPVIKISDAMPPEGAKGSAIYLHPTSQTIPLHLIGHYHIDENDSFLKFRVAGNRNGDWLMIVKINNKTVLKRVVNGKRWHEYNINVKKYRGKNIKVDLFIKANGWYYEYAFIDEIILK